MSAIPSTISTNILYPDFRDRVALYRALIDYVRLYCKFEGLQSKIAIEEELNNIKREEEDARFAIDIRTLQKACNTNSKIEALFIDRSCEIIDISDLETHIQNIKDNDLCSAEDIEALDEKLNTLTNLVSVFIQSSKSDVSVLLEIIDCKAQLQEMIDACTN